MGQRCHRRRGGNVDTEPCANQVSGYGAGEGEREEARTDDDVYVSTRKTCVDEDAADFFLHVTPRQLNVDVIGPFELNTGAVGAQHSPIPACVDDGKTSKVLHEYQTRCRKSAEWCTDEERELETPLWREPGVGPTAPPCELECGQRDDWHGKRCQKTRIPV